MKDGLLQQCDTPLNLYHDPVNMFVAGFLGTPGMNFIHEAKVVKNGARPLLDTGTFKLHLPEARAAALADYVGKEVVLGLRPAGHPRQGAFVSHDAQPGQRGAHDRGRDRADGGRFKPSS
jgi:ABC-type sugar transport system ATPase subunit